MTIKLLSEADCYLLSHACSALERLGTPAALPALDDVLTRFRDKRGAIDVTRAARRAIGEIYLRSLRVL